MQNCPRWRRNERERARERGRPVRFFLSLSKDSVREKERDSSCMCSALFPWDIPCVPLWSLQVSPPPVYAQCYTLLLLLEMENVISPSSPTSLSLPLSNWTLANFILNLYPALSAKSRKGLSFSLSCKIPLSFWFQSSPSISTVKLLRPIWLLTAAPESLVGLKKKEIKLGGKWHLVLILYCGVKEKLHHVCIFVRNPNIFWCERPVRNV